MRQRHAVNSNFCTSQTTLTTDRQTQHWTVG